MSYIIRNYGATVDVPFKNGHILMQRDGCIVTNNVEEANAFSGIPGVSVVKQPGTVDVIPPPAPEPEKEIDYQKMLKKAVLELAKERGLEVPKKATKAILIELLIADDEKLKEEADESDEGEQPDEDEIQSGLKSLIGGDSEESFDEYEDEIMARCKAANIDHEDYDTWKEAELAVRETEDKKDES